MLINIKFKLYKNRQPALSALLGCLINIRNRNLASRFRSGDKEAFEKIYRKFHKPILNYVRGRIREEHLAEEVTQETFLKAYRFRESYDSKYGFSTWLWTIARNSITDWLRKHRQYISESGENFSESRNQVEDVPANSPDPELTLIEMAERESLITMMRRLTHLQKEALLMRLIHQLSYAEIAQRLNLSLSAAKCLVHRAKKTLLTT